MKRASYPITVTHADGTSTRFESLDAYELHLHPVLAECGPMKRNLSAMLRSVRRRANGSSPAIRAKGALEYIVFRNRNPLQFDGGEERAFDSCFEMSDGAEVIRHLRYMADRTPEVRQEIERHCPTWARYVFDEARVTPDPKPAATILEAAFA